MITRRGDLCHRGLQRPFATLVVGFLMVQIVPSQLEISSAARVSGEAVEGTTKRTIPETGAQKERRRALVVPREHGAWGMLLVPLTTGAAAGLLAGGRFAPVLSLTAAVLVLFWLRTPVESWLGAGAVLAQTPEERRLVRSVILPLATIAAVSLLGLFWRGQNRELIWLGMMAGVAFAAQIVLKKMGRATRVAAEMAGALTLTSTAPAAYCAAMGRLDETAWALWLVNWLFAANQIHFVWLRIRGARAAGWSEKLSMGWSFLAGQMFLVGILVPVYRLRWLPEMTLIAFAPVCVRGLVWFATKPQPIVIRRLGWTEFAHALVFGVLLITGFIYA